MPTRITIESLQLNALGQWSPSRAASCVEYVREMYPRSGVYTFNPAAALRWASSPREAYHRCIDIPPSGPITAEDVSRECLNQERRAMSSSTPAFVVSPDLHTAAIAAAASLVTSDIEGLSPEDFEFLDAMVLFPYPVWFTSPGHRYVSEVSALTLRSRTHAIMTSAGVDAIVPAVQVVQWQDLQIYHPIDEGVPMPPPSATGLSSDGSSLFSFTRGVPVHEDVRSDEGFIPPTSPDITSTACAEDIREDVDATWGARYVYALSRLIQTGTANCSRESTPARSSKKSKRSALKGSRVTVVSLSEKHRQPSTENPSGREFNRRWVVRMHKVHQWYPKEQVHKVIWRGPYIKGPQDAPIKEPSVIAYVK